MQMTRCGAIELSRAADNGKTAWHTKINFLGYVSTILSRSNEKNNLLRGEHERITRLKGMKK